MKLICINCPRGCHLEAEQDGDKIKVTGNACFIIMLFRKFRKCRKCPGGLVICSCFHQCINRT